MAQRKRTDLIVVHVTATPATMDIGAAEVDRMHRAKGWSGIGYHFVVRRNGKVEAGRHIDQVGAHVEGWNSVSIGISLVGGVDARGRPEDNRTDEQTKSLVQLIQSLLKSYPQAKVCGHRDLSPDRDHDGLIEPDEFIKACPCFDAIPWARSVGLPVAAIKGYWDKKATPIQLIQAPDGRPTELQKLLKLAGYEFGPVDGVVGLRTTAAIRQFQEWAGLPVTGVFDDATTHRLRTRFAREAA